MSSANVSSEGVYRVSQNFDNVPTHPNPGFDAEDGGKWVENGKPTGPEIEPYTFPAKHDDRAWQTLVKSCAAEFLGVALFVFIGSLSGTSGGTVNAALAHGLTIFVLIAGMGHISGGHFNPAVTLGVVSTGNMPILNAVFYVLSQLIGGFVGSLFARAVSGTVYIAIKGGITVPAPGIYPMEAITSEAILTYLLVTTVLMTAVDTDANILAPLAIGLSIAADIFAGAGVSGASMNPARSLGPAMAYSIFQDDNSHWDMHYVYWVGPIMGSLFAALFYKAFLANDEKRWLLK